ncbi:MAG: gamma-glutamyltransferase [Syntrophobacteraceae bacterium]
MSTPLAAEVGARILETGGNAIDAAAAIQFALNVVEPHGSGIGGGGFMLVYLAEAGESFMLDSREKAPERATPNLFQGLDFELASTSGVSVGVPGTLLGLSTALDRWGTLSLADVLQPAIKLAEEGFIVDRSFSEETANPRTAYQRETRAVFRLRNGSPLPEGFLLKQRNLARTFRLIAKHGPDIFYRGQIGRAVVAAQKRSRAIPRLRGSGKMTTKDLAAYNVAIRQPVVAQYRGYTLKTASPPSSGGLTMLQMLKMLERYPMGDRDQGFGFGETKTLHVMIEAMRLAFADRAVWTGDEDFVPVPKTGLLADPYVQPRSALIDENSRMPAAFAGDPWPHDVARLDTKRIPRTVLAKAEGTHTTHFSVIDRWGNIVSYTTTIETSWGSGIMVPGYGFLLNNELTDFNFTPELDAATGNPGANDIAPFKRPRSSMTPTMIFKDGVPIAAYGSPGGPTIINSVLQTTINFLDHGMTLQQALDAPRISVAGADGTVSREAGFAESVIADLMRLGHPLNETLATIGSVQAVGVDPQTGARYGAADPRGTGVVITLPRIPVRASQLPYLDAPDCIGSEDLPAPSPGRGP